MKVNSDVKQLHLSFPENHLNILERRQLFERCHHYLPNLESLIIKTHDVYIIQCTPNYCIKIVDDKSTIQDNGDLSNLTKKLYHKMVGNYFSAGITVV